MYCACLISDYLITVSKTMRKSLGPAARGRTIQTKEKGNERTRYPLITPLAIRKELQIRKIVG